jgi:MFS family permease
MGPDLLSGCRDRCHSVDRVAVRCIFIEEISSGELDLVRLLFCSMWTGALSGSDDFFRVLQGFTGGVLIPLSFVVILTYLPPSKQPIGMALFSITATFAPAIGPLIGGWLTDNYGWPFVFT